jgi:hypothetical protein
VGEDEGGPWRRDGWRGFVAAAAEQERERARAPHSGSWAGTKLSLLLLPAGGGATREGGREEAAAGGSWAWVLGPWLGFSLSLEIMHLTLGPDILTQFWTESSPSAFTLNQAALNPV